MIHMRLTGRWETAEKLWMISHLFNCYWLYWLDLCPKVSAQPWMPAPTPCSGNMPSGCWRSRQCLGIFSTSRGTQLHKWLKQKLIVFFALATSTCKCFLSYVRLFFLCDMPKGAGKPCICWWTPQFWQQNVQYHQHHQYHPNDSDHMHSCSIIFLYSPHIFWCFPLGLSQDFYSYSASINACARCQRWSHALALASFLSEQRQPPNGIMWGAIVGVMPRGQAPSGLRGTRRSVTGPSKWWWGRKMTWKWWKDIWFLGNFETMEIEWDLFVWREHWTLPWEEFGWWRAGESRLWSLRVGVTFGCVDLRGPVGPTWSTFKLSSS